MWTAGYENQDVLFFQLPSPEVERTIFSCSFTLIGIRHTNELTNFFPDSFWRIVQSGSEPEWQHRLAKAIVQLQGKLSPLVGIANVQC
jgi:hypothetical protein